MFSFVQFPPSLLSRKIAYYGTIIMLIYKWFNLIDVHINYLIITQKTQTVLSPENLLNELSCFSNQYNNLTDN